MKKFAAIIALAVLTLASCADLDPEGGDNSGKDTTNVKPASKSIVIGICPSGLSATTKGYYKKCINDAGGVMLVCDNYCWTEADANAFVQKIDGLISPGSTANDADGTGLWPYKRSKSEDLVIIAALSAGKPILGICYGHQRLNSVMGGNMATVESLAPDSNVQHRVYNESGTNIGVSSEAHNINIEPNSKLCSLLGVTSVMVNTSHTYALNKISPQLTVTARADDGIVEAVEGGNVMGVQFHPEYLYGKLGIEKFRFIFDNLVLEAKKVKENK